VIYFLSSSCAKVTVYRMATHIDQYLTRECWKLTVANLQIKRRLTSTEGNIH